MASSDSLIDKPQRRRRIRAELPDVIINTGTVSNNSERGYLPDRSLAEICQLFNRYTSLMTFYHLP